MYSVSGVRRCHHHCYNFELGNENEFHGRKRNTITRCANVIINAGDDDDDAASTSTFFLELSFVVKPNFSTRMLEVKKSFDGMLTRKIVIRVIDSVTR